MRFSVHADDPGYANWLAFRPFRVLLDGEVIDNVITADGDSGEATVCCVNELGSIFLNDEKTDAVKKTVHGILTFELSRRPQPLN